MTRYLNSIMATRVLTGPNATAPIVAAAGAGGAAGAIGGIKYDQGSSVSAKRPEARRSVYTGAFDPVAFSSTRRLWI